ncbi:MAG TPA: hypothetical protein VKK79_23975 [Candidatus Lokiarchaeia archaeon]|nr:hypothetical protein [Candidatus Lokiarchaeia archaeon]
MTAPPQTPGGVGSPVATGVSSLFFTTTQKLDARELTGKIAKYYFLEKNSLNKT